MTAPGYQIYFNAEHEMLRDSTRRFVEREIAPHVVAWEEAGSFPHDLYRRLAEIGWPGSAIPKRMAGRRATSSPKSSSGKS